ncbi:MAG: N-acetyl-gamma-glutamyl-phosphate reductase [Proteobacteria bacterium]|nr:N-acetyl-gamma-glutamyl-phosphate reductase [Pseudomonadota bacterium]NOG61739.1 N-acetyl-gamma-glutamyl-phosphate reductase [Pseudomonadota bacterium]
MISVGIVGATGYTGVELLRLLSAHEGVDVKVVTSNSEKGKTVTDVFPSLRSTIDLIFVEHESEQLNSCDLIFFATPHAIAMNYVPKLLEHDCKIIDLSADFRIKDVGIWEKWYQVKHVCPELLQTAVYGLPELNRAEIKRASLIANPGCYPTAITLALLPALKQGLINPQDIIADAKSGVSGAGRKAALASQFSEVAESFKAYSASGHRHLPEIIQSLNLVQQNNETNLSFIPHLVPMNRGMFATIYVKPTDQNTVLQKHYVDFYADEPFVDVMPERAHPDTRSVKGSNTCRIAIHPGESESQPTVILSVIDNLVKGAAGQAIQNMNLMFGLDEGTALSASGLIP